MQQRTLGRQGLEVSALGLGCMGMTFAYSGGADPAECEATLLEAVDRGVTLIDTAEVYGPYSNEQLLGRCLAGGRRDRVVLATKFGFRIDAEGRIAGLDSRPEHIREVVEASLQRLAPTGSTCSTSTGSTRRCRSRRSSGPWPVSSRPAKCATSAFPRPAQPRCAGPTRCIRSARCSPNTRCGSGASSARCCRPAASSASASCPTRRWGGASWPDRRSVPRSCPKGITDATSRGSRASTSMRTAACWLRSSHWRIGSRATPAQVALAWLLAQGPDLVPIFGTTRRVRLRENLGALKVELAASDWSELGRVFAPGRASGERYGAAGLAMLDRVPGK